MGVDDVVFPTDISQGSTGGPAFSTTVIGSKAGFEQRNINWSRARASYNVAQGVRNDTQQAALMTFFYAQSGKAYGFLFLDHRDHATTDTNKAAGTPVYQTIGTGDGSTTTFQLVKVYSSTVRSYTRKITRPKTGTITIKKDGVTASSGVSVSLTTGIVTFTSAPADGVVITADFEFYVPVRFDVDNMSITLNGVVADWDNIPLVEVRE